MTVAEQLRQVGRQEGVREALEAIANRLFKQGKATHEVAELTGLSTFELEQLKTLSTN